MPKKFTPEDAARFGLPKYARLEIPLTGRDALRQHAAALVNLAATLDLLARDTKTDEPLVVVQAYRNIINTNNNLRNQKG